MEYTCRMLHLGQRVGPVVIASHLRGRPMFKSQSQCYCLNLLLVLFFASICFLFSKTTSKFQFDEENVSNYFGPLAYQFLRLSCLKTKGKFLWDDLDQDQWSEISWIMVDQNEPMNPCPEWIHQFIILI